MTKGEFVVALVQQVPEAGPTVAVHFDDYDELLLHLLMADLLRLALSHFKQSPSVTGRLLALVERALLEGDAYVENAVCVSFVEHVGAAERETGRFLSSWPAGLLAELKRQRAG